MFPSIVCIYRTVISTCVLGQFFFIVSAYNSNYNGCSRNNCVWPAEMTSFVRLKQRDSHIKSLAYTHANQFLLLFHMDAHTDYGSATAIQRQTFFGIHLNCAKIQCQRTHAFGAINRTAFTHLQLALVVNFFGLRIRFSFVLLNS